MLWAQCLPLLRKRGRGSLGGPTLDSFVLLHGLLPHIANGDLFDDHAAHGACVQAVQGDVNSGVRD